MLKNTSAIAMHNSKIILKSIQLQDVAIPLPNPQSPIGLDGGSDPAPIKPSSLLFVQFPPPPAPQGELVLNGVDAVADGGENDKEDDDDDGDDDVTLDHDGGRLDQAVRRNLDTEKW